MLVADVPFGGGFALPLRWFALGAGLCVALTEPEEALGPSLGQLSEKRGFDLQCDYLLKAQSIRIYIIRMRRLSLCVWFRRSAFASVSP